MSSRFFRISLIICNFLGILCFKFERNQFRLSKLAVVMNIFVMPVVLFSTILIRNSESIQNKIYITEVLEFESYSTLSIIVVEVMVYVELFTACALSVFNFRQQKLLLNFMNRLAEFSMHLKYQRKFEKLFRRCFSTALGVALFVSIFQFYGFLKVSFLGLLASTVLFYPYMVILGTMTYLKSFELFLVMILKNFKMELKSSNRSRSDSDSYQIMMRKYQKIYEFAEEFNMVFGCQTTILVANMSLTLTLEVNSCFRESLTTDFETFCSFMTSSKLFRNRLQLKFSY